MGRVIQVTEVQVKQVALRSKSEKDQTRTLVAVATFQGAISRADAIARGGIAETQRCTNPECGMVEVVFGLEARSATWRQAVKLFDVGKELTPDQVEGWNRKRQAFFAQKQTWEIQLEDCDAPDCTWEVCESLASTGTLPGID